MFTKKWIINLTAIIAISIIGSNAYADCNGKVLEKAIDHNGDSSFYKKGQNIEYISQYVYMGDLKNYYFCQHGGSCYQRFINKNGKKIEAIQLTNCKIGKVIDNSDGDIFYDVYIDRNKNNANTLKRHDAEAFLRNMDASNIFADNAAEFYAKKPNSKCALLVKSAMGGNKVAKNTLRSEPSYCFNPY